jgi:hypothetical protein
MQRLLGAEQFRDIPAKAEKFFRQLAIKPRPHAC